MEHVGDSSRAKEDEMHRVAHFGMLLAVVWSLSLAAGCSRTADEPARPANLPAGAFWLGGPDGGVFVSIDPKPDTRYSSYSGTVFHPDGSVWYRGRLMLEPPGGAALDTANRSQFAGWDGTQILLQDGRALVARPPAASGQ